MSILRHTSIVHFSLSTAYFLHTSITYLVSRIWTTACAVATMLANYRHTVSFPCGFGSYSRLLILFAADSLDIFFYFPVYLNFAYDTRVKTRYLYVRASGSIARQDNLCGNTASFALN